MLYWTQRFDIATRSVQSTLGMHLSLNVSIGIRWYALCGLHRGIPAELHQGCQPGFIAACSTCESVVSLQHVSSQRLCR